MILRVAQKDAEAEIRRTDNHAENIGGERRLQVKLISLPVHGDDFTPAFFYGAKEIDCVDLLL